MEFRPAEINNVWIGDSPVIRDTRGSFHEWFKASELHNSIRFNPVQANTSVSDRGVIRGIHFSNALEGQRKLLTCLSGSLMDFFVDLRKGSETFLQWGSQLLTADSGVSIFLGEGIGHAFQSLERGTQIVYLLDSEYQPQSELSIYPFDQDVNIEWPLAGHHLSDRDAKAPSVKTLLLQGNLPTIADQQFYL